MQDAKSPDIEFPDDRSEAVTVRLNPTDRPNARPPVVNGRPCAPKPPNLAKDYEFLDQIGRGGMGVVYLAYQPSLKRKVAYKVLTNLTLPDPDAVERFRGEAELLARLQHPNIVQVFDSGTLDGMPFLVMEYVPGGSLARSLREQRLSPPEAARLIATIARALGDAHAQGIIHRDLNPANILLTTDGQPKVADFGLARDLRDDRKTCTGVVVGTPLYMAPEQLTAAKTQTAAVDVWALGVILYEALTGTAPFGGGDAAQVLHHILDHEAVSLRSWQPNLPRDLETICLKCLQKDPHRRYATANELADDLERFLENRTITARPVGRVEKSWRWCRRNPTTAALAFSVLLLVASGAAAALVMADQAMHKQEKAVADAREEMALRQQAENAVADEKKELASVVRARNEAEAATAMLESLLQSIQPGSDPLADLRKELDATATRLKADHGDPIVRARLLFSLAMTMRRIGEFEPAVEPMEISFELRMKHLSAEHPISRRTAFELSYTYVHVGRGDDAVRVLKPALDLELAELPPDSAQTIPLLQQLRIAYHCAGRAQEEESLGEQIVALTQKHFGEDDAETHWARANLTTLYRARKRHDLAIPILEKSLAYFKVHDPPTSIRILWTRGSLGESLLETDQPEKAYPYLRERYEADAIVLGLAHRFTVASADILAQTCERTGRFTEAAPLRQMLADHYRNTGNDQAADFQATRVAANKAGAP